MPDTKVTFDPYAPIEGPLEGIRVLALENYVAGPLASMLLADWGADVVKVEPPGGDTYRSFPPVEEKGEMRTSAPFARINRGKRSVVLDLRSPGGAETFRALARECDVVLENLKPGTLDALGVGWEALSSINPRLVMVSISGFGQRDVQPGPFVDMPALDLIGQAMSGIAYTIGRDGDPPAPLGFPIIDTAAADWAVMATLVGLRQRDRRGQGQHLDVSMFDVAMHLNEYQIGTYAWSGVTPARGRLGTSAPFDLLAAKDGYFAVTVSGQAIFERFCRAIGQADLAGDPRFSNGTLRRQQMDQVLGPLIEAWASSRTVAEVVGELARHGVPASPVRTVAEVYECEHASARDMIVQIPDPVLGPVPMVGNPLKGTDLPPIAARAAPQLGSSNGAAESLWPPRPDVVPAPGGQQR